MHGGVSNLIRGNRVVRDGVCYNFTAVALVTPSAATLEVSRASILAISFFTQFAGQKRH